LWTRPPTGRGAGAASLLPQLLLRPQVAAGCNKFTVFAFGLPAAGVTFSLLLDRHAAAVCVSICVVADGCGSRKVDLP
jgi:hypothetical protein